MDLPTSFEYSCTRNAVSRSKTALWLTNRSPYRATDLEIPKKRTRTIATPKVRIGGWLDAIVINQPLETVKPMPPMKAIAPKK